MLGQTVFIGVIILGGTILFHKANELADQIIDLYSSISDFIPVYFPDYTSQASLYVGRLYNFTNRFYSYTKKP